MSNPKHSGFLYIPFNIPLYTIIYPYEPCSKSRLMSSSGIILTNILGIVVTRENPVLNQPLFHESGPDFLFFFHSEYMVFSGFHQWINHYERRKNWFCQHIRFWCYKLTWVYQVVFFHIVDVNQSITWLSHFTWVTWYTKGFTDVRIIGSSMIIDDHRIAPS